MIARTSRLCAAHLVAIFVAVLSSFAAGQNIYSAGGQGTIPNECCPEPSALFYADGWYGDGFDAGTGLTDVTLHGTCERKIPMPPIDSGLDGVAGLYHRTFVIDTTSSAWGGTYVNLKGGNIPVPVLDPTKLVGGEQGLQPRRGNMPGLYLYTDGQGSYYQYGGPIDTGPNPQSTGVFTDPVSVGGGTGNGTGGGSGNGSSFGSRLATSGRSLEASGDDDTKPKKSKKAPPTAAASKVVGFGRSGPKLERMKEDRCVRGRMGLAADWTRGILRRL